MKFFGCVVSAVVFVLCQALLAFGPSSQHAVAMATAIGAIFTFGGCFGFSLIQMLETRPTRQPLPRRTKVAVR